MLYVQFNIIFLSQNLLMLFTLHKWYPHALQDRAPTVDHKPTTRVPIQQACFLFFTNNFHTGAYFLTLNGPASNTYAKVT